MRNTTYGYTAAGYLPADKVRQKFTSQERDNETGLDYMHARYFASAQGRFTSADTFSGSIGNPQSLNRYAYVNNNPLNFTDPTGHMPSIHLNPKPGSDGGEDGYSYSWDDPTSPQPVLQAAGIVSSDIIGLTQMNDFPSGQPEDSGSKGDNPQGGTEGKGDMTTTGPVDLMESLFFFFAPQHGAVHQGPGPGATAVSAQGGRNNTVIITYDDATVETRSRGSRSWRNNNPGNIRTGARLAGEIGAAGGFAVFETEAAGQAAIVELLSRPAYQRLTVSQAIARWAPPNENNTPAYQQWVQNITGINGQTQMNTLNADQLGSMANAIRGIEGWNPGTVAYGRAR